ncbi:hypothetical protein EG827_03255 [bacterium]|nr:hypothetical protein [bacterium]
MESSAFRGLTAEAYQKIVETVHINEVINQNSSNPGSPGNTRATAMGAINLMLNLQRLSLFALRQPPQE